MRFRIYIVPATILVLLLLVALWLYFRRKGLSDAARRDAGRLQNLSSGIATLHQVPSNNHHPDGSGKIFSQISTERLFSWSGHPSLVTDAVENGWPRFAFTTTVSSSVKSGPSLLGFRGGSGNRGINIKAEIGWVIWDGSRDFMQKIRLNPGLKKIIIPAAVSAIRAALPLPGPQLGGSSSFPQEAYFEIIILPVEEQDDKLEQDTIKLIGEGFHHRNNSPDGLAGQRACSRRRVEEVRHEEIFLSIGLTGGGPLQRTIPGTYPGSIGFNSSGSVYLDGRKAVSESENGKWGTAEKVTSVIGCGYNPSQKTVCFTVDSQPAYAIHCKSDLYASPLYPTIAANADMTVFVNLGQSPFKYAPANAQRTPNPCFIKTSALSYDDSMELFSMGRIDSRWRQRSRSNTVDGTRDLKLGRDFEEDDLFEIPL